MEHLLAGLPVGVGVAVVWVELGSSEVVVVPVGVGSLDVDS